MIRTLLAVCVLGVGAPVLAAAPAAVCVLDGPEVVPMHAALDRLSVPYRRIAELDQASLRDCRVLVVCGKPSLAESARARVVEAYLHAGNAVLGIGGGAGWMIANKLFDARAYCPSGTTIHMSGFQGYHRLTFGYPGAKPLDGWTAGVPMLLRATEGPLMEVGPRATSILAAGGPYSLAAFQRVGKGLVLLISADPQGGNACYMLGKLTPTTGDRLKTDRLLANAIAFLQDPCCNLIPNPGFEENTDLPPAQSHWQLRLRDGATGTWCKQGAPAGEVFLKLSCPKRSSASVTPVRPIAVERGAEYTIGCLYKASVAWKLELRLFHGRPDERADAVPVHSVPPQGQWTRHEMLLSVPADVSYVGLALTIQGPGELCLDELCVAAKNNRMNQ